MRKQGQPTRYPGVTSVGDKTYQIRGAVIDPRTGKKKEVHRLLNGVSAREAAHKRAELIEEARRVTSPAERIRIGEFARSWLESKALKIDKSTIRTYGDALLCHVLPTLGDFYYDALTTRDVQAWVDKMLVLAKGSVKGGKKPKYSVTTIHGWFRAFRTMTRDAVVLLDLPRDPTLRIAFPPIPEREDRNCISARELARFLEVMKADWPQHYALTVVLAFTGMRFCHASALKWEDLDEDDGVLRVRRKQRMGEVGPVSRKKRVPRELPVEPQVVEILRWHRQRQLEEQAPGLAEGWMFPSADGTLRQPSSVYKAWAAVSKAVGIRGRFTVHGLRYTFNDLTRRAGVNGLVTRSLTGHVTEDMTQHYSTIGMDEKRAAVASVLRLVPMTASPAQRGGTLGGTSVARPEPSTVTGS